MTVDVRPFSGQRFKKWLALPLGEKAELFFLLLMALTAEVAVKVVPIRRLTRFLGIALVEQGERDTSRIGRRSPRPLDLAVIEKRAQAVDRLYRLWPRQRSCLRRALVLGFRVRAANPVMLIGVARENDTIRAHAWIEIQGRVIGERSGDFAPLRAHNAV